MGRVNLPNGFWTDFDGLVKIYYEDLAIAKKIHGEVLVNEIDFIRFHVLPQWEVVVNKKKGNALQKMAYAKGITFLKDRITELETLSKQTTKLEPVDYNETRYPWLTINKNDIDFVKGTIEISFAPVRKPNGFFLITKDGVTKKCPPETYLELMLENFYEAISKLENESEKILNCYEAEIAINRVIDNWELKVLGYDVERSLADLSRVKALLEKRAEVKKESNFKPPLNKRELISFQWPGDAAIELPILFKRLVETEMIDEETLLKDFIATFTAQSTIDIKPIKWIADNRLLAHLLHTKFKGQIWQSIASKGKLFCTAEGKPITNNDLANAKSRLKNETKPKGIQTIDKILSAK